MNFIGTGGEDWVDLDLDLFERSRHSRLQTLLIDDRGAIAAALGTDFDVEDDDGLVFLVIDGRRRYRVEVANNDRLLLTGILDSDGPL